MNIRNDRSILEEAIRRGIHTAAELAAYLKDLRLHSESFLDTNMRRHSYLR